MTEEEKKTIKSMKRFVECRQDMTAVTASEMKIVLNLLEKKDRTIQQLKDENKTLNRQAQQYFEQGIKKDKIIDEIQKEVRGHIGFENRLKRDNKEPDLFNQGRFYVANNINNILKGK